MVEIECPICGEIFINEISLYDTELKKQNFDILPINPKCNHCKSTVKINKKCDGGRIIVLNGTCGSGKSTIAYELLKNFGYYIIDGDCVKVLVKNKLNIEDPDFKFKVQFNSKETLSEIATEIDNISLFSNKFVLSHIILPQDLDRYIKIFTEKNLDYHFYLLNPLFEKAVERCQSRNCHNTKTSEDFVRYYHERLTFTNGITIIDNTNLSVDETVNTIITNF